MSSSFLQGVLDALTAHVCVLDDDGVILMVNRAWREYAAANDALAARVHEGNNYLNVCGQAVRGGAANGIEALPFSQMLQEVLRGHRSTFQLEYACHSPSEQCWFVARVSRMEGTDPMRIVVAHDNVTQLKLAQEQLRLQASTDELTGVANRRSLMTQLAAEYERVQRHPEQRCGVLAIDLDHFKQVNDTWGHAVGDEMLRHVTRLMQQETRSLDVVGRSGGEEFTVLLPDTGPMQAFELAERLRKCIEYSPLETGLHTIAVTVSIGISVMSASDADIGVVLSRADSALYDTKNAGRNAVHMGYVSGSPPASE